MNSSRQQRSPLLKWLLAEEHHSSSHAHPQHPWWQVIYLTGVDVFGEGDIPVTTREILRQDEPDPHKRPRVHVGSHH
jgi:hypothetical protein